MRRKPATALIATAVVLASATSRAQDVEKESIWNGVVTGAGAGATVGVVLAATTDSVCSVRDCMALLAVAGGAIGLAVDRRVGRARPVEPGWAVDDTVSNGALIGAGVASTVVLIDFAHLCRTPRGCTTEGVVRAALRGALFGAAVGALVDAAIPSKAARNADEPAAESRRFSLTFGMRF